MKKHVLWVAFAAMTLLGFSESSYGAAVVTESGIAASEIDVNSADGFTPLGTRLRSLGVGLHEVAGARGCVSRYFCCCCSPKIVEVIDDLHEGVILVAGSGSKYISMAAGFSERAAPAVDGLMAVLSGLDLVDEGDIKTVRAIQKGLRDANRGSKAVYALLHGDTVEIIKQAGSVETYDLKTLVAKKLVDTPTGRIISKTSLGMMPDSYGDAAESKSVREQKFTYDLLAILNQHWDKGGLSIKGVNATQFALSIAGRPDLVVLRKNISKAGGTLVLNSYVLMQAIRARDAVKLTTYESRV